MLVIVKRVGTSQAAAAAVAAAVAVAVAVLMGLHQVGQGATAS